MILAKELRKPEYIGLSNEDALQALHSVTVNEGVLIPEYKLLQYSTVVVPDMVELDRLFVLKAPTTIYLLRDI